MTIMTKNKNGVTLHDYFAAKAMQGSLANNPYGNEWRAADIAEWSYKVADAMIKKRNERMS
jgi:hypothetical protein